MGVDQEIHEGAVYAGKLLTGNACIRLWTPDQWASSRQPFRQTWYSVSKASSPAEVVVCWTAMRACHSGRVQGGAISVTGNVWGCSCESTGAEL